MHFCQAEKSSVFPEGAGRKNIFLPYRKKCKIKKHAQLRKTGMHVFEYDAADMAHGEPDAECMCRGL
jgi:hypothetical protein